MTWENDPPLPWTLCTWRGLPPLSRQAAARENWPEDPTARRALAAWSHALRAIYALAQNPALAPHDNTRWQISQPLAFVSSVQQKGKRRALLKIDSPRWCLALDYPSSLCDEDAESAQDWCEGVQEHWRASLPDLPAALADVLEPWWRHGPVLPRPEAPVAEWEAALASWEDQQPALRALKLEGALREAPAEPAARPRL